MFLKISNKKHKPSKMEPISTIKMFLVSGMPLTCGIIKFDSLVLLLMRRFILQRTGETRLSLRQQPESKQPGVNRTATNSFSQRRHRDTQKEKNAAQVCSHPPTTAPSWAQTQWDNDTLNNPESGEGGGIWRRGFVVFVEVRGFLDPRLRPVHLLSL